MCVCVEWSVYACVRARVCLVVWGCVRAHVYECVPVCFMCVLVYTRSCHYSRHVVNLSDWSCSLCFKKK